jgi:PRTRC genetic system protein E
VTPGRLARLKTKRRKCVRRIDATSRRTHGAVTVAREDDKALRVNVIPKKVKDDEHQALTTPLSYTGTPEELDAELGKHLASYVECHTQLGSSLAQAKAEMEAAAKAAQEEARKKGAERGKKATDRPTTNADSAPAAPATPPLAATMTLFGGSQPTASDPSPVSPTATATTAVAAAAAGGGGESTYRLAL